MRAVLFDFSGTLFRLEHDESWVDDLRDESGAVLAPEQRAEITRRMTATAGASRRLPPEFREAWERRDLDPDLHRLAYVELLRRSEIPSPHAEALYERMTDPLSWSPYPDTAGVLRDLHASGVRIAVISNIAFDIRPAFERLGVRHLLDDVLLSFEEGLVKPDPKLFRRACDRLGVEPDQALMVGDDQVADAAAAEIGCAVALVDPVPTAQRPTGLRDALDDRGL